MGSIFSPKVPAAPAAPPPANPDNFRDDINKVEIVRIKNPDGTFTQVQRRLPLSAEEQAAEDNLRRIATDSMKTIEELSSVADPTTLESLKPTLDAFYESNKQYIDDANKLRTTQEEKALARAGQADSTAAVQARGQRGRSYSDNLIQLGRDKNALAGSLRDDAINKQLGLFGLATGRQDVQASQLANALNQGSGNIFNQQQLDAARNNAIYQGQLQQQQLKYQSRAAGMQTLGQIAGLAAFAGLGGFGAIGGASTKPGTFFNPAELRKFA